MEPYQVTEVTASLFGMFALVGGMGASAWKNYSSGMSHFPRVFIWGVCIPSAIGMGLRAITFLIAPKTYWFLMSVDICAVAVVSIIIAQHFGFLLKKH